MSNDELLSDLTSALNWASVDSLANTPDFELAEKIIDAPHLAGYCKRRTVTTTEELDALGPWAVVIRGDVAYQRGHDGWYRPADTRPSRPEWIIPATVLFVKSQAVSEP
jgi:hypothetical protein